MEEIVMNKVLSNQITMKPKWYFFLGSALMFAGTVSIFLVSTFLTHLTIFSLRPHGPMGQWRFQQIIESFPLWVPLLAVIGSFFGFSLLKKYDFSYKKNLWLIVLGFIVAILFTSFVLNISGLDNIWTRQGPLRNLYKQDQGSSMLMLEPSAGRRCQACGRHSF